MSEDENPSPRVRIKPAGGATPLFSWGPSPERAAAVKRTFDDDGYVHMKPLMSDEEVAQIRTQIGHLIDSLDKVPDEHQYCDVKGDAGSLKQIQRLNWHSEFFASLAGAGKMQALAETLLGEGCVLQNIQYFNKPPGTSKITPAHQDGYYFHIKPNRAVTMWLALDPADEANGCLVYTEGSHTGGIRLHQASGILGFSQKCTDYGTEADLKNERVMTAAPGDIVAHNSMVLHRAGRNTSVDRQRRAIGFIYFAESAKEDKESAAAYQKTLNAQLKDQGKI